MKKILVVEDNEQNMYLFRYILNNAGYKVIESRTGEEGVELAKNRKPDLVIMDIQLPDIDGLEAAKRIKEFEGNEDLPIIAVTSYAMVGDREKILSAGCAGYIEKPIKPDTFLFEIEKYLSKE